MKTEREISELWQMAHLKFDFGEQLAVNAMLSRKANMDDGAAPVEAVAANNHCPGEPRKEPAGLEMRNMARGVA